MLQCSKEVSKKKRWVMAVYCSGNYKENGCRPFIMVVDIKKMGIDRVLWNVNKENGCWPCTMGVDKENGCWPCTMGLDKENVSRVLWRT